MAKTMTTRLQVLVDSGRAINLTAARGEEVSYRRFLLCGDDADGYWYERETFRSGTEYYIPHPEDSPEADLDGGLPGWCILVAPSGSTATLYPEGCESPEGDAKAVRRFLGVIEAGDWEDI